MHLVSRLVTLVKDGKIDALARARFKDAVAKDGKIFLNGSIIGTNELKGILLPESAISSSSLYDAVYHHLKNK